MKPSHEQIAIVFGQVVEQVNATTHVQAAMYTFASEILAAARKSNTPRHLVLAACNRVAGDIARDMAEEVLRRDCPEEEFPEPVNQGAPL